MKYYTCDTERYGFRNKMEENVMRVNKAKAVLYCLMTAIVATGFHLGVVACKLIAVIV